MADNAKMQDLRQENNDLQKALQAIEGQLDSTLGKWRANLCLTLIFDFCSWKRPNWPIIRWVSRSLRPNEQSKTRLPNVNWYKPNQTQLVNTFQSQLIKPKTKWPGSESVLLPLEDPLDFDVHRSKVPLIIL